MFNNVFISYAKEDIQAANRLHEILSNNNFEVWLDSHKILPGQDWNNEIRIALKKADYIILLLSNTSVVKRGYVQREFKLALEYCEPKLDDDIYIIPCKLDECDVPDKLSKYQWVNLNDSNSFDLILTSLNTQRSKYIKDYNKNIALNNSYGYTDVIINRILNNEYNSNSSINICYPKFTNTNNDDLLIINSDIENNAMQAFACSLNVGYNLFPDLNQQILKGPQIGPIEEIQETSALNYSYSFELISTNLISISTFEYSYTGGAHGNYYITGHNYKINPYIKISIENLFDSDKNCLPTLRELCVKELLRLARLNSENPDLTETELFLFDDHVALDWNTFDNFYLTKQGVNIIFNTYQETAYVWGAFTVLIPFEILISLHPALNSIKRIHAMLT